MSEQTGDIVVRVSRLSRRFGRVRALQRVSFAVTKGERVALFGDNGAGKSTLLRVLAGLSRVDEGEAELFSVPLRDYFSRKSLVRRDLPEGYQASTSFFYSHLTVRENLELYATLRCGENLQGLMQAAIRNFSLESFLDKRISECSQGMARRASLARALLGNPALILLDEPTLGLDRDSRQNLVRRLTAGAMESGQTLIFASHDEEFISEVATRVVVLQEGRLISDTAAGDNDPAVMRELSAEALSEAE